MVRWGGHFHSGSSHGISHVHHPGPAQRLPGFGDGAVAVLRHSRGRGNLLQGKVSTVPCDAGRRSLEVLHGEPHHPAAVPGDPGGSR